MDQAGGNPEEDQPKYDSPNPKPVAPVSGQPGNNAVVGSDGNQNGDSEKKPPKPAWWREMTGPDWITAIATLLIFITTAIYTHYAKKQWGTMQGQLDQMTKQLPELQRAAKAAEDSSRVAHDTLVSNNQSSLDTLSEMKEQSKAMKDAAAASGNQVAGIKESNRINRESLESVQRAFVTYLNTKSDRIGRPRGTYFYDFIPVFQNSGVTPAKVVGSYISSKWADQRDQLMDESLFEGENPSFASLTIGPKAEQPMGPHREEEASIFGVDFGSDLSRFHEGKMDKLLVIWAWIAYRDIFSGTKLHLTEFCDATYGAKLSPVSGVAFYSSSCVHHNCTDEDCPDYGEITKLVNHQNGKPRPPTPDPN